jgi:putative transposase
MTKFDVSERLACRVLGQHRSTQRKAPKGRADDAALTADIVALATEYGRYGYRRITAMLHAAGWAVNVKRVERIWRLEGLKVPAKQPKKGRLWLNDGSCVRLRPERPNHVWSYDFVEDRTHNGRKFRMLNVIDEFTRECLAIRIDRKLKSTDVIDVLSDLFICAACRAMSDRTTVRSSSPRPCGNGSPPSGRRPPSSSPAALGRTACRSARSRGGPGCRATPSRSI